MTDEEAIKVARRHGLPIVSIPPTGGIDEVTTVDFRDPRKPVVTRRPCAALDKEGGQSMDEAAADSFGLTTDDLDEEDDQLERTIETLIERLHKARADSASWRMVVRQLDGLRNSRLAEQIMEEYGYWGHGIHG